MLVGDMPFGSYEYDDTDLALRNAYRFVQEGHCDAVKLEGGSPSRAKTARKIVDGGGTFLIVVVLVGLFVVCWLVNVC
jgi:3-methyl-2-oxobutanoate hydroxymethyltransferase